MTATSLTSAISELLQPVQTGQGAPSPILGVPFDTILQGVEPVAGNTPGAPALPFFLSGYPSLKAQDGAASEEAPALPLLIKDKLNEQPDATVIPAPLLALLSQPAAKAGDDASAPEIRVGDQALAALANIKLPEAAADQGKQHGLPFILAGVSESENVPPQAVLPESAAQFSAATVSAASDVETETAELSYANLAAPSEDGGTEGEEQVSVAHRPAAVPKPSTIPTRPEAAGNASSVGLEKAAAAIQDTPAPTHANALSKASANAKPVPELFAPQSPVATDDPAPQVAAIKTTVEIPSAKQEPLPASAPLPAAAPTAPVAADAVTDDAAPKVASVNPITADSPSAKRDALPAEAPVLPAPTTAAPSNATAALDAAKPFADASATSQAASPVEQVIARIKTIARPGITNIRVQLEPVDLGSIEVKLQVSHDGKTGMIVTADQKHTLDMMQRDARGLEQLLTDSGLKADSGSLSFHLRGEQQGNQQNFASGSSSKVKAPDLETATPEAVVAEHVITARSGVDIRV